MDVPAGVLLSPRHTLWHEEQHHLSLPCLLVYNRSFFYGQLEAQ